MTYKGKGEQKWMKRIERLGEETEKRMGRCIAGCQLRAGNYRERQSEYGKYVSSFLGGRRRGMGDGIGLLGKLQWLTAERFCFFSLFLNCFPSVRGHSIWMLYSLLLISQRKLTIEIKVNLLYLIASFIYTQLFTLKLVYPWNSKCTYQKIPVTK